MIYVSISFTIIRNQNIEKWLLNWTLKNPGWIVWHEHTRNRTNNYSPRMPAGLVNVNPMRCVLLSLLSFLLFYPPKQLSGTGAPDQSRSFWTAFNPIENPHRFALICPSLHSTVQNDDVSCYTQPQCLFVSSTRLRSADKSNEPTDTCPGEWCFDKKDVLLGAVCLCRTKHQEWRYTSTSIFKTNWFFYFTHRVLKMLMS